MERQIPVHPPTQILRGDDEGLLSTILRTPVGGDVQCPCPTGAYQPGKTAPGALIRDLHRIGRGYGSIAVSDKTIDIQPTLLPRNPRRLKFPGVTPRVVAICTGVNQEVIRGGGIQVIDGKGIP